MKGSTVVLRHIPLTRQHDGATGGFFAVLDEHEIKGRFIFSASGGRGGRPFIEEGLIERLTKPADINDVRKRVVEILSRLRI